jgi:aminopeptidase N
VLNDKPIVGYYGVNDEGSGDMYYKGGNMLLAIRTIINNDEKFRDILHGLNATFYHQTVTGKQIEDYISKASGIDFSKVFQQYLTTTMIPEFDYYIKGHELHYRWSNVVTNFNMPLKVTLEGDKFSFIYPTEEWKTEKISLKSDSQFKVDNYFYVTVKKGKS